VVTAPPASTVAIRGRIARMKARIARWETEARGIEPSWIGGPAYRKFCDDLAGAARQEKATLETTRPSIKAPESVPAEE
jgi:hypothetical protein